MPSRGPREAYHEIPTHIREPLTHNPGTVAGLRLRIRIRGGDGHPCHHAVPVAHAPHIDDDGHVAVPMANVRQGQVGVDKAYAVHVRHA